MPTSEWKAATSSGIEVIGTRRAITAPMRAADGDAEHDQHPGKAVRRRMAGERGGDRDRHADHAEEIALAATMAGLDSPRSDRMNSTPATR